MQTSSATTSESRHGKRRNSGFPTLKRDRVLAAARILPLEVLMNTMTERWDQACAVRPEAHKPGDTSRRAEKERQALRIQRRALQDDACGIAIQAAPYLHPKLAMSAQKNHLPDPNEVLMGMFSAAELHARVRGGQAMLEGQGFKPEPAVLEGEGQVVASQAQETA